MLVLSTLSEDSLDGLTKQDLIAKAQPHSDSSFSIPSDPSKFYTAWASMKTLETKELVYKFGRPTIKYALTDEGWEVAKRMKETLGVDNVGITEPELSLPSTQRSSLQVDTYNPAEGLESSRRNQNSGSPAASFSKRDPVPSLASQLNEVDRDEEDYFLSTVAGRKAARSSTQWQRTDSDLQRAEYNRARHKRTDLTAIPTADNDCIEILDSPPAKSTSISASNRVRKSASGDDVKSRRVFMQELENQLFSSGSMVLDDEALAKALVTAREMINSQKHAVTLVAEQRPTMTPTSSAKFTCDTSSTQEFTVPAAGASALQSRDVNMVSSPESLSNRHETTAKETRKHINKTSSVITIGNDGPNSLNVEYCRPVADSQDFSTIDIPAGSFTVEIIVDTREVRTKVDRDYIPSNLAKLGVHCTSRAMELGDMLWVARIQDPIVKQRLDLSDQDIPEIVLDYIVERKRLDDLDASIKDTRFTEQKFRLKRSGIRNVVYLVEDYGSVGFMPEEQHQRLVTSITATQVIDGLFVKRTRKLDDTIAYLARMTKLLKKRYDRRGLTVIPSSVLTSQNHIALRNLGSSTESDNETLRYITYSSFASLLHKSNALTLRDVFLKMLMCTRGITGDKAIEIQRHWETPRAFVEALQGNGAQQGSSEGTAGGPAGANKKRDLVWSVAGDLVGRRKIGRAVSARVGEIWGFEGTT